MLNASMQGQLLKVSLILKKLTLMSSNISSKDSFRTIMVLVAQFNFESHQMDVRTAFLNGQLYEEVYMSRIECFEVKGKEYIV